MIKLVLTLGLIISISIVHAVDIPLEFEDIEQQERYQQLLDELRCLVCQNQTLADSHADLAQDLRSQVYSMVNDGQSNQAIADFLVQRYGDFVLYRPPLKITTLLLWFGPFVLLLIGLVSVYRLAKSKKVDNVILNQEDRAAVSSILNTPNHQNKN
jgi:cytochrome c-type biogenesis protein CcmH